MTTMYINFQLVTPSHHIANNIEIELHTFANHFIAGLFIVYADFCLQL